MTWNVCKLSALLLVLSPCFLGIAEKHSAGTASVSGRVKGGSDAAVVLHLEAVAENPVRYYDGYEAVPAPDGTFSFTEIPPGDYRLTVEPSAIAPPVSTVAPAGNSTYHPNYDHIGNPSNGFTAILPSDIHLGLITLHPGEARKGVVIELIHQLSFCGHLTRDDASLDAWGLKTGPPKIVPVDSWITYYHLNTEFGILDNETKFGTNADGSFSVTDLAPGTYFVKSGNTWYPGTNNFSEAKPVVVTSVPASTCTTDFQQLSQNICGADEKVSSWDSTIIGQIAGNSESDKNKYKITFLRYSPAGVSTYFFPNQMEQFRPEATAAGQMFSGNNVCPGEYEVSLNEPQHTGNNVWGDAPAQKIVFDSHRVTVAEHHSAQLVLTPHPMAAIEGTVLLDKITREEFCPGCQQVYVSILRDGNGEFQTVTLSSGNHFDFRNVSPGEYQIFVTAKRLDKVFLQSIVLDGVEGKGNRFTVPEAKFYPMTVTLSGDLAQAAGHASPDVRHAKRWQTEGMRPLAIVAGKVDVEKDSVYTVRLLPISYNSNAEVSLTTQTAADGSFHFDNVPPGIYRLRAHDKNLLRFDYGAKAEELRGEPLLIAPGEALNNIVLKAPRYHSICGHFTDASGYSRTTFIYYRSTSARNYSQQNSQLATDNEGYFRIDNLLAGDYFIQRPTTSTIINLLIDGQTDAAAPIHIEGEENPGCGANSPLEVRVPTNSEVTYSVSGLVSGNLPARLGDRFVAELEDATGLSVYGNPHQGKLDADHEFILEKVPVGRYKLNIYGVYGPEPKPNEGLHVINMSMPYYEPLRHLVASQLVTVSNQDIADLKIVPLTLPSVTGTVHIPHPPDNWKDFKPSDLSLKMVPYHKNGSISAPLDENGAFTIGAVDPGEYQLQIVSTDRAHYFRNSDFIQSASVDGKETDPRFLSIPAKGSATLEVELDMNSKGASVQVHLLPDNSFSLPAIPLNERCGWPARVYEIELIRAPLYGQAYNGDSMHPLPFLTGRTVGFPCKNSRDGKIENIPPGSYYAIAGQDLTSLLSASYGTASQEDRNSEASILWKELAKIATLITLHPGEQLDLNLPDKTIEVARIAARLGLPAESENLRPQTGRFSHSR